MKLAVILASSLCLLLNGAAIAHADPLEVQAKVDQAKEDLAKEVKDEIAVRHMTCLRDYGVAGACGEDDNTCNATLAAVSDFQVDLSDPSTQKRAVYRWWRFVSAAGWNASCMKKVLSGGTYCKAAKLVKAFDPQTRCPSGGGTNATCWINRNWELSPLLLKGEHGDWIEDCQLWESEAAPPKTSNSTNKH